MASISVCMIVKNEEKNLEACLTCLKDIADEILIADTGSTDATKEIAARFTDKIYDFAWTGSFSDARNFIFSKAKMDYIYSADADERLDEENIQRFLQVKKTLLPEIEIVQMYYCNQLAHNTIYNFDKEYRPKLFKRVRNFVWQEKIHEQVLLEPVIYDSEIVIIHQPDGNHAKRDLAVFASMITNKEELSKRLCEIYAKELLIAGDEEDFAAAGKYFANLADKEGLSEDEIKQASLVAARYYRYQKEASSFFKYALRVTACGGCSEMCCEIGEYYFDMEDYKEASMWFYNAVYETQPLLNIRSGKEIPLKYLSECMVKLGLKEEAENYRHLAE